jgi:hypothetical protein
MTYKGQQPVVKFLKKVYCTDVSLTQKEMAKLEKHFGRLPRLAKWFVRIEPIPSDIW